MINRGEKMIDGNRLVEALSLPSHDKRVLE